MLEQANSRSRFRRSHKGIVGGLAAASLLLGGITAGIAPAVAQEAAAKAPAKTISLNFTNASIQTVLRTLFSSAGKNYTLDPAIHGTVNLSLSGVSFDTALNSILAASNPPLQADFQNGAYRIAIKKAKPATAVAAAPAKPAPALKQEALNTYSIPVDSYDAALMASLIAARGSVQVVPPNYVTGGATQGRGASVRTSSARNSTRGASRHHRRSR